MPTVQASPEVVRQMKADLNKTVNDLQNAVSQIISALNTSMEWNDAQGGQFRDLMSKIGRLLESPIETLRTAQPKLEKLAQSLDSYSRVRF